MLALKWRLNSVALRDAYTDFFLSRQAKQVSPATLEFYKYTVGVFLAWAETQGIGSPEDVTARNVRAYLASLTDRGLADSSIAEHATAIRTLLKFWNREGYLPAPVIFEMPKVAQKRQPVLSPIELREVIAACHRLRDRALVMVMVDSGLRKSEVISLNWDDIDFSSGLLRVKRGKGGKARSAVVGATARRALLAYRRNLPANMRDGPMFMSQRDTRLTAAGVDTLFRRLQEKTGIHVTPHALRRTFTIMSLRSGMDVLHPQALGGWSGLEMVRHYAQLEDVDLLQAHQDHSPIDRL
jgi:site-specific recombinase XerD